MRNVDPALKLNIIRDHLPENDFLGHGKCVRPRAEGVVIDTLVVHACCVDPAIAAARVDGDARELAERWYALKDATDAPTVKVRGELEFKALNALITSRHGAAGLEPFSKDGVKDVFEFYGISAHYLIDRQGTIFELVEPQYRAFHVGPSRMPRTEDARDLVNGFSVGIELLALPHGDYTDAQYAALAALTKKLMSEFPINNIYGHCHLAPGRKTDPANFNWTRYIADAALDRARHHLPSIERS